MSAGILSKSASTDKALKNQDKVLHKRSLGNSDLVVLDKAHSDTEAPSSLIRGEALIRYISREMIQNKSSTIVANIKLLLSLEDFDDEKKSVAQLMVDFIEACNKWKSVVGYGKIWDHKKEIKENFGTRCFLAGRIIEYDVWSNIHYGYIGRAAGFSEYILSVGAGIAQAKETGPIDGWLSRVLDKGPFRALDDPRDQEAIRIGFEIYRTLELDVSEESILDIVRNKAHRL